MTRLLRAAGGSLAVMLSISASANPAVPAACDSLTALALGHATVVRAESVAAGVFAAPRTPARSNESPFRDLPAFCRVEITSKPSTESSIAIEVWLPVSGWNGKFQGVGNGGWAGSIDRNALAGALRRGYAAASTDTGHQGGGGPWMESREKLIDFGSRAIHEMAVAGKAVVAALYGSPARQSYFTGCSGGGRQGMKAAQQFPHDFDGIVSGAPAVNTTGRAAYSMWVAQRLRRSDASYVQASKYPVIHEAVVSSCDALDGVRDGVLENPRACTFEPNTLLCKGDEDRRA